MEAVEISNTFVWVVLAVVFLVYVIFSIILDYHWKKYGMDSKVVSFAKRSYFIVSGAILFISIVSALLFILH